MRPKETGHNRGGEPDVRGSGRRRAPLPVAAVTCNGAWLPAVDVRELPDEYIVLADLIAGARRDRLHTGGVPFRLERPTGRLLRSLRLPDGCDATGAPFATQPPTASNSRPRSRRRRQETWTRGAADDHAVVPDSRGPVAQAVERPPLTREDRDRNLPGPLSHPIEIFANSRFVLSVLHRGQGDGHRAGPEIARSQVPRLGEIEARTGWSLYGAPAPAV